MILHPPIMALLLGSVLVSMLLLIASGDAIRILRGWNAASGSEEQLRLERRTYLVSTMMAYACAFQIVSVFLFIYTADDLAPLFVGAMCAAGTLFADGFGYPTLILKILGAILAGAWLILNRADNRGRDYPLIRVKYTFLLALAPVVFLETAAQAAYFGALKADIITSCCGSLFSTTTPGLTGDLAGLPVRATTVVFYAVVAALVLAGWWFRHSSAGGYPVAALGVIGFVASTAALVAVISPYIYELPTHRCPFCILQREYHFIGYPIYALLLTGVIASLGVGLLHPHRNIPTLRLVVPPLAQRLSLTAVLCFGLFAALSAYLMLATSFRLEGW